MAATFSTSYYGAGLVFYTGTSATSSAVPGAYDIAIDGHPYLIDDALDATGLRGQYFRRETVPLLRAQADTGNEPDQASINPADLWRRTQETWVHGAGQVHFDRKASDSQMFYASKGVNPWVPWQLTLLPDVTQSRSSANTGLLLTATASHIYLADGSTLRVFDGTSWGVVTGTPGTSITGLCSDGTNVYSIHGGTIYVTPEGGSASSFEASHTYDVVGYANGRLMAGSGRSLYNITAASTPGSDLAPPTLSGSWRWTCFADGYASLYAAGFAGSVGSVWQLSVNSTGTALTAPQQAEVLPVGETPASMCSYQGVMVLGTSKGVRVATVDQQNGNLSLGGLISTGATVSCLAPWDRWVYFGWTNYDSASTGLGRVDLSVFTNAGYLPAYASDLMVTGQGAVTGLVMSGGQPFFAVAGLGVYVPSTNLVPSGTISQGLLGFDLTDAKTAMFTDLRCLPLPAGASISVSLTIDASSTSTLDTVSATGATGPLPQIPCREKVGETFSLSWTLSAATDPTQGPTLKRVMLRAQPVPNRAKQWTIPILMSEADLNALDSVVSRNLATEKAFLFGLASRAQPVTLQVLGDGHSVFVTDVNEVYTQKTELRENWQSTIVLTCLEPSQ